MKKQYIFFLIAFYVTNVVALVPIEGILYGDVKDIKQFDPFTGMLNSSYIPLDKKEGKEKAKLTRYLALYKQGNGLANFCEKTDRAQYSDKSKEDTAIRSTVANLQYLGLDFTIRSIANYSKLLEFTEVQYQNMFTNLVTNSCSQNISVFSHKMLKANFKYFRTNPTGVDVPSIESSPYFSESTKVELNSRKDVERSLHYSIRNFKSLCSWNGSTDNFGLLTEYVKNPFLMSFVFNNMLSQKINIDSQTGKVFFDDTPDTIQVACENLICRRRPKDEFKRKFPTINGSVNLEDDLKLLYCNYFQTARTAKSSLSPEQVSWTENTSKNSQIVETMNLVAQITGMPDMMVGVEKYSDLSQLFKNNIKERWDKWAKVKSSKFNSEQLYEESLEVSLVDRADLVASEREEYQIDFNIELGEIDKLLGGYDKIETTFSLDFPYSYIEELKGKIAFYYNTGRFEKLNSLESDLRIKLDHQLALKKKFFKVPLWNERMSGIIAKELMEQFVSEKVNRTKRLSQKFIRIPINFHFGIFALQYIRGKNKFSKMDSNKQLTFKQ